MSHLLNQQYFIDQVISEPLDSDCKCSALVLGQDSGTDKSFAQRPQAIYCSSEIRIIARSKVRKCCKSNH